MTASSIAVVLHDFAGGGSERIAIRLGNRWAASGRHVTLVCGAAQGPLSDLVSPDVEITETGSTVPRGPGSRKTFRSLLGAWAKKERPDVLFFPGNYHMPLADHLARHPRRERPALVAKISNPLKRPDRNRVRQFLFDRIMARRLAQFDRLVSMSPALSEDARRLVKSDLLTEIAEPTLADDTPPLVPPDVGSRHVLTAGRFVPQKNLSLALRAFAALPLSDATLTILGDGPERQKLLTLANNLGVADRVTMPGYVPDIGPWLDKARLFLLSSVFEGYPAVIVEALGRGRPVATTDSTPALREMLPTPEHGIISRRAEPDALRDAMLTLLEKEPPDAMMLAGSVAHHRISTAADSYLGLFDGL